MKIAVLREHAPLERRVAATPGMVRTFIVPGAGHAVESGAAFGVSIADREIGHSIRLTQVRRVANAWVSG